MSMTEKYGNFSITDAVFYDEIERKSFEEKFLRAYRNFISRVNGKKIHGQGKMRRLTPDEKMYLKTLNIQVRIDEEQNVVNMVGYGHRRTIFPLEVWFRQMFDEGKIVTYKAVDNLNRSVAVSNGEDDDLKKFYAEQKRRVELFKKGELEPPLYRRAQARGK